ncbi:hypothetical protein [Clostridium sp. KNHs205]|nr:hypothetical protein [Clostridium sp. KNHs205]
MIVGFITMLELDVALGWFYIGNTCVHDSSVLLCHGSYGSIAP